MIEFVGDRTHYIAKIPNIIPIDVCSSLVEQCKVDYEKLFYPGPTLNGVDPTIKWTMDFDFSGTQAENRGCNYDFYKSAEDSIERGLWAALSLYIEEYRELQLAPNFYDTGFRLQHYKQARGYYRHHHDGAPWDADPTNQRVLGAVIYLNTIERGGETGFPVHGVKCKATAGSIAFFPASWTHPHQSCVPISSDKWIVSTFIMSDRRTPTPNEMIANSVMPTTVIDTKPD